MPLLRAKGLGPKDQYDELIKTVKIINVCLAQAVANWQQGVVGSGANAVRPLRAMIHTGITANSRWTGYGTVWGLSSPTQGSHHVDFSKNLELHVIIGRNNSDAEFIGRIQIGGTAPAGTPALSDLAVSGIGLKIENYVLTGEAYGTARGEVTLLTMTEDLPYFVQIKVYAGVRVEFWVNRELKGTLTGSAVPNAPTGAERYLDIEVRNGATGGVDCYMDTGDLVLIHSW